MAVLVFSMVSAAWLVTATAQTSESLTKGGAGGGRPTAGAEAPGAPKEFMGKDGAPMVLIPSGEFVMGAPEGIDDEQPEHRVWVDAFYLDKYEVTNARYDKFLEERGHARPKYWDQLDLSVHGELPVVGVDWRDAQAYCEWAEKRLPMEAEWEYAARGKDRRRYPWGNTEPTPNLANYGKRWSYKFYQDRLESVTSHEAGTSPYGIYNMAGNVFEWVADWYEIKYYVQSPERNPPGPPAGELKVARGGSWNFASEYLRTTSRMRFKPMYREADVGMRCARDSQ
ncbi:MAG: formylglycine-generating enzyme family protein [Nitrospirae bacterium]|nr:formylglycine-generating enzyme family protein [Nitrospirota bacterium]